MQVEHGVQPRPCSASIRSLRSVLHYHVNEKENALWRGWSPSQAPIYFASNISAELLIWTTGMWCNNWGLLKVHPMRTVSRISTGIFNKGDVWNACVYFTKVLSTKIPSYIYSFIPPSQIIPKASNFASFPCWSKTSLVEVSISKFS